MSELTFQERVFVSEYARTSDPVQSYATAHSIDPPFDYQSLSREAFSLLDCAHIKESVKAFRRAQDEEDPMDKEWVLRNLRSIVGRCMTSEPVRTKDGEVIGQFTFQAPAATRALELVGKELGMFKDQGKLDVNVNDPHALAAALEEARVKAKG